MTDLVYSEMVGWYDPDIAYCTVDDCHELAVEWKVEGMTNDNTLTLATCLKHY